MTDVGSSQKLTWVIWLLAANVVATLVGASALFFGLLPKVERAVAASERVEARFQAFANEVQPVLTAGAGKAIETIKKVDADQLSETATKKADALIESAAERAKRYLERDKNKREEDR